MRITKLGILVSIGKIIERHGGNWSHASTATMLDLLKEHHKIKICARTYYRHMQDLRAEGLIRSIRRYGKEDNGKIYRRTSAVCITIKGFMQLFRVGWKWALSMAKKLRNKYITKKPEPEKQIIKQNIEAEKKEADTLKDVANRAIKEGISMWDYVMSDKLKLPR